MKDLQSNSQHMTSKPIQHTPTSHGIVWLVGAGPGDPGLITVRALRCIQEADVIVHDFLANPSLLEHSRPDAQRICAGKRAGRHAMPQEEINALLVRLAFEGKRVCRLKGGDPFLFGRGGEEALCLVEHGIPFEVVPGVTSALAVPAYAGIPVTHRGIAPSVHIVTGHEDPSKEEGSVDWNALAGSTSSTLVFLMARRNVRTIADRLTAGAWPPNTPAAVIANGTLPTQKAVFAPLAAIADLIESELDDSPALLVVGKSVALSEQLRWVERKPLFGKRIVVTRARKQISELALRLESLGADVIQCPAIQIESMAHTREMRDAVSTLADTDWVVFTSVNGVEAFFGAMGNNGLDTRALASCRVAAIGPSTAERLQDFGIRADLTPKEFVAESLLQSLEEQGSLKGSRFLLPRSDLSRPELSDGLLAAGAEVHEVIAYRTIEKANITDELLDQYRQEKIDLTVFTSSSTVRGFVLSIPEKDRASILARMRAASIGPITSATLKKFNVPVAVTANPYTIPALVEAITRYFQESCQGGTV